MSKLDTLTVGAVGFTSAEIATPALNAVDASGLVQVVVQVIIGIATLIGLFKKKK